MEGLRHHIYVNTVSLNVLDSLTVDCATHKFVDQIILRKLIDSITVLFCFVGNLQRCLLIVWKSGNSMLDGLDHGVC